VAIFSVCIFLIQIVVAGTKKRESATDEHRWTPIKKGWERHFKKPVLSLIDLLPNRSKPKLHSIGNAALGLS